VRALEKSWISALLSIASSLDVAFIMEGRSREAAFCPTAPGTSGSSWGSHQALPLSSTLKKTGSSWERMNWKRGGGIKALTPLWA